MTLSTFSCRIFRRAFLLTFLTISAVLPATDLRAELTTSGGPEAAEILAKMEAAYAKIDSYQTDMEVREYRKGKFVEAKRFLYTFKKPNRLRIDMVSPQPGTTLIYPDRDGKVILQFGGWNSFMKLHLAPDNSLLASGSGQRIDQSDFGLLIRNLGHSLTDRRRGGIRLSEEGSRVVIEVLADDHFLPGIQTLYRVVIDKTHWLPLELLESSADGSPRRKSLFRNLKAPFTVKDGFFLPSGSGKTG